jgi:biopolymer transport protein ExbD
MLLRNPRSSKLIFSTDANAFSLVMALVAFALLTCCMTTMGYHYSGSSIDLPKVLHPSAVGGLTWGANRHDAMIVAVARDGDTFMKNDKIPSSAIAAKIHQCLGEGAEPKVYIRVDASARYRSVKAVLDAVQSSGVKDVAFLADQRKVRH